MEVVGLLCLIFFITSFIMAKFVLKFVPERYQYAWWMYSVWGIFWIETLVTGLALYQGKWSVLNLYWARWAVFGSALPGMIYLNYIQWQRWKCQQTETIQNDLVEVLQRLVDGQDTQIRAIENVIWTVLGPDVAAAFTRSLEELKKDD